jgi:hypothetical protein
VLPLLAVYVTYGIAKFPAKMAEGVAKSVRAKLLGRFEGTNRDILGRIFSAQSTARS